MHADMTMGIFNLHLKVKTGLGGKHILTYIFTSKGSCRSWKKSSKVWMMEKFEFVSVFLFVEIKALAKTLKCQLNQ